MAVRAGRAKGKGFQSTADCVLFDDPGQRTVCAYAGWGLLKSVLHWLLGASYSMRAFTQSLEENLALGLPFLMVWAYYGMWLKRDIESLEDVTRRGEWKRPLQYLFAAGGLVVMSVGGIRLSGIFINFLFIKNLNSYENAEILCPQEFSRNTSD